MNVAAKCRLEKEQHPERYCADKRCLWHLASGPCPKHSVAGDAVAGDAIDLMMLLQESLARTKKATNQ